MIRFLFWRNKPDWKKVCSNEAVPAFAPSGLHGIGVFARQHYCEGDLIEAAPVIPVPKSEFILLCGSCLHFYYFLTGQQKIPAVLALGMGSLYNHACPANAVYEIDIKNKLIYFRAVSSVSCGEEITINYNGPFNDTSTVIFDFSK